jgi:UDPglucose--hexose-1-phosphate uridylyltransferase
MRVVPNKYPVVRPSLPSIPQPVGPHITMTSHGHHELIIESPKHNANPTSFADDHIAELISTYRQRFDDLLARPGIKTVILFRNYGAASGASLRHPHSQIIALGMTPPRLRSLADRMQQCWDETGRCASCDELKLARADGTRVVTETSSFLAMVPFAASAPFETWIIPKRHQTSFTEISSAECPDFGRTLRSALRRLRSACNDPPYNLVVESFDFLRRPARHAHWRLRIVPSLATWGGFELASGISINPASPEENADLLRNAVNV